ncbi:tryptophan--tRNA ligase [Candidatus Woesearchaeota archaeon]|nr:tryptophan--tRNA ligase [Candidatus Woesearchaeota archaeon]
MKVTPWEVEGDVDYNKLIKEFGINPMPKLPSVFNENILFKRKIVFAQRDFDRILSAIKNKKKFVMMTGLMPSGKFHLGHAILAQQMVFYQKLGAKIYIAAADLEAYNTRQKSLEELRKIAIEQYLKNYIAIGLNPKNCDFYFQSERSKEYKKSNAYYRLASNFSRYATFNEFKAVYGEISPGKMNASLLQASDMFHSQLPEFEGNPLPVLIPVGSDQDPHIRLARGIGSRYKDYKFMQLSSSYHIFLPGLKGGGKMSSSDESSFIAMDDSPKQVENKIKKYAFSGGRATLKEHKEKGGNPDVDVSYQYLSFFEENEIRLKKIHDNYKSGSLLTSELKQILIDKLNKFLKEHQERKEKADIDKFISKD